MQKAELLLPAGNEECLRAAVNNGADAVYLGLNRFNARRFAGNFDEKNIFSVIDYCHKRNVKVYVALNTLVKNDELKEYFSLIDLADQAKADAVIIQDTCFVPIIKKNFPGLKIHLSTQATVTNSYCVPEGIDRVILARELALDNIKSISAKFNTEVFVHGALCFSYSGQCLFSSIAGGRSGNRGMCAQPCRKLYNNKYCLSTMDLCLLEKLPEIIGLGVKSLKIEGRMRSPLYVQTVARIYRKAIDYFYECKFKVEQRDIEELKLVFNREFTTGFAYNKTIVDSRQPMNRGLYIGNFKDKKIQLRGNLKVGDGIGIWKEKEVTGYTVKKILKDGKSVLEAYAGEIVELESYEDSCPVYKTSSADMKLNLGQAITPVLHKFAKNEVILPKIFAKENNAVPSIFVKVSSAKSALAADNAGADIIYYDLLADDCENTKQFIQNAKFFVYTPRIITDNEMPKIVEKINSVKPDGVLVGNRGLLKFLDGYELHLDYSFNMFNDIDLRCYPATPIISPELNFNEVTKMKDKNFIVLAHGDIILMNTKEKLTAPELVDEEDRHFRVRENHGIFEILNSKQLGLFNKARQYVDAGIKYFLIDTNKEVDKFIKIYRRIIHNEEFDDKKIKKGYTTGHFERGV